MNIKKYEIVNYIFALIAMITFMMEKFVLAFFNLRIVFLVVADISFLIVGIKEKVKDKYVLALDTIVFCVLFLIHVSILFTARYINIPGYVLIMLIYFLVLSIFLLILISGYSLRIRSIRSKDDKLSEINSAPEFKRNRFSNTEIEKEFAKKLKNNN